MSLDSSHQEELKNVHMYQLYLNSCQDIYKNVLYYLRGQGDFRVLIICILLYEFYSLFNKKRFYSYIIQRKVTIISFVSKNVIYYFFKKKTYDRM